MSVRLATFNLMSGRSLRDGLITPGGAAESAQLLDADVLAVQEVDRNQHRSGQQHQPALMAGAMGATSYRFVETVRGVPGEPGWTPGTDDGPETDRDALAPAGFGVALLSRLPVREWHVLRLEPGRGRFPIVIPARPPRVLWLRDEPRAAVAAVLADPPITIACTHLSFMPARSARQLKLVREWLQGLPGPRILLGDLNLPAAAVGRITPQWTPLVRESTFPSPSPRFQLDHVLAHGLSRPIRDRSVRRMPISDHCAITLDLRL